MRQQICQTVNLAWEFRLVGSDGTISSYDYEPHVTVQTRARPEPTAVPVRELPEGRRNPVEYMLGCIASARSPDGCLDPDLNLIAQRIVDTAFQSAELGKTLKLLT